MDDSFVSDQEIRSVITTISVQTQNDRMDWPTYSNNNVARWDGEENTWDNFVVAFLAPLATYPNNVELELTVKSFIEKAINIPDLKKRYNFLATYNMTIKLNEVVKDLSNYQSKLYRFSGLVPAQTILYGWGLNVYTLALPNGLVCEPDEIKSLLQRSSQQSMGGTLYQFDTTSVQPVFQRIMNTPVQMLQECIPNWDPMTMHMVEVICESMPPIDEVECWVGQGWRPLSGFAQKEKGTKKEEKEEVKPLEQSLDKEKISTVSLSDSDEEIEIPYEFWDADKSIDAICGIKATGHLFAVASGWRLRIMSRKVPEYEPLLKGANWSILAVTRTEDFLSINYEFLNKGSIPSGTLQEFINENKGRKFDGAVVKDA